MTAIFAETPFSGEIVAAIAALSSFGFLVVATVAGTIKERRKRELEHVERIKRIEAGLADLPDDRAWPRALVCAAIGAGVPVSAFVVTLIAYLNKEGVADEVWIAPVIVSVVSVIAASSLAYHLLGTKAGSAPAGGDEPPVKPLFDPDLVDVVGRRG
jgi:hypothetical protein